MITFAKAGGPPNNWPFVQVTDLETGEIVRLVYEVDTVSGYVIVAKVDERGHAVVEDGEVVKEKRTGRFKIDIIE